MPMTCARACRVCSRRSSATAEPRARLGFPCPRGAVVARRALRHRLAEGSAGQAQEFVLEFARFGHSVLGLSHPSGPEQPRACDPRSSRSGVSGFYRSATWKSPGCGDAFGVNSARSGLRSSNGVSSRQSKPRTVTIARSIETSFAMDVPIGFGRAGDLSGKVPREVPSFAGLCMTRSRRERCRQ